MNNLPCAIWLVGFPLSNSYGDYVTEYLLGRTFSESTHVWAALICLIIWAFVGFKLYRE